MALNCIRRLLTNDAQVAESNLRKRLSTTARRSGEEFVIEGKRKRAELDDFLRIFLLKV